VHIQTAIKRRVLSTFSSVGLAALGMLTLPKSTDVGLAATRVWGKRYILSEMPAIEAPARPRTYLPGLHTVKV
jgi:hypothetical protein